MLVKTKVRIASRSLRRLKLKIVNNVTLLIIEILIANVIIKHEYLKYEIRLIVMRSSLFLFSMILIEIVS